MRRLWFPGCCQAKTESAARRGVLQSVGAAAADAAKSRTNANMAAEINRAVNRLLLADAIGAIDTASDVEIPGLRPR
jgi:hypothetical protein